MTKEELQQKLEQTEKLLEELKAELMKAEEKKEWPQAGDPYIYINSGGSISSSSWEGYRIDVESEDVHNIFKPSDQPFVERLAKKQAFQRLLEKTAYELNEGWVPDWNAWRQSKYFLYLSDGDLEVGEAWSDNYGFVIFKSEEAAQKAIALIGEDVLKEGFGL